MNKSFESRRKNIDEDRLFAQTLKQKTFLKIFNFLMNSENFNFSKKEETYVRIVPSAKISTTKNQAAEQFHIIKEHSKISHIYHRYLLVSAIS